MSLLGTEREGSSSDGFGPSGSHTGRPHQITISGRVPAPRWASPWWLLVLGLAIAEVVALGVREYRVPTESDWAGAAEYVRGKLGPKDAITVAPGWADPLLRLYLGDRITAKISGRSDLAGFERLWVLSIRGANASDAPPRPPDFAQAFGRVRVQRYDLGPSKVLFDLADSINSGARREAHRWGRRGLFAAHVSIHRRAGWARRRRHRAAAAFSVRLRAALAMGRSDRDRSAGPLAAALHLDAPAGRRADVDHLS